MGIPQMQHVNISEEAIELLKSCAHSSDGTRTILNGKMKLPQKQYVCLKIRILFSNFLVFELVFKYFFWTLFSNGNVTVSMNCKHYERRKQTKSPVSFKDGKLQATNTIVQHEHAKRKKKCADTALPDSFLICSTMPEHVTPLSIDSRTLSNVYFAEQQKWYIIKA